MLLKNLMEDKQLDFNRPLLSVRRFTSPVATSESEGNKKTDNSLPKIPHPPIYKSELKSGPVRNPGTVPFVWEKTPGRPKEENNLQTLALEQPPIAPKLPPGRALNDKQQSSRKGSDGKTFALSQTEIVLSSSQNVSSLTPNETKYESTNGEMEDTGSSGSKDSDEAYLDALDTLSRTESFFLNCSISGVSGLDGPDIKPSGIFSSDPQTQDFMMGRFLPAAKAVASETPPYATRKQPLSREPPRQIKKVVITDKHQPLYASSPNKFSNHAQDDWWEESEDEDDCSQSQNSSAKVCGLLPQFLLKNSFCLLNPIPGMKIQAQKSVKPANSVHRRQAKSSYLRSCSETDNEHAEVAEEKGLADIVQTEELIKHKNNQKSGSSQKSYRSDCQKPGGASLFRHLQGNDVSSYPSQISQLVYQEKGFLGILEKDKNYRASSIDQLKKGSKNFQELLAIESISQESGSGSPVVEKTLYVDSVHKVISSNSDFSDRKALTQCMEDDLEIQVKPREMEGTPLVDSSLQNIKHLNSVVDEKAAVQHKSVESVDAFSLFSVEKYAPDMKMDATDGSRMDQDLIQNSSKLTCLNVAANWKDSMESQVNFKLGQQEISHGLVQDSNTFTNSKVAERRKIDLESPLQIKSSNQGSTHGSYLKLPLAPPLPKAPSESWLKRTLPTVSSRNSSSLSCLGKCNYIGTQACTAQSGDPKWEIIVRSSNIHHGHLRFSEEQLPPIPEA
ncbi:uncharacterized protein LOC111293149 [Durio zibethinus]|uniref:Uncharacterized protein LOC111293149 n=1 Tax=Durio zibethinus TaxID=66656 RepID=A0A6P5YNG2_DURZI|nr:uncharacterized protein LOC111293149 [Durio zibethinus]XP_022741651.1 uncharacterized protein LOC111293149 [Durio zibethinus]